MRKWRVGHKIPKTVNHDKLKQILEASGWECEVGGKHVTKMVKAGELRPITIPRHSGKDFGPRLRDSILKAAGLI